MKSKLYVGNLSYSTEREDLQDLFSQQGTVNSVNVIVDRDTGRSKGFGFVEMASEADANAAIEKFDGYEFMGRALRVNIANEKERSSRPPRR